MGHGTSLPSECSIRMRIVDHAQDGDDERCRGSMFPGTGDTGEHDMKTLWIAGAIVMGSTFPVLACAERAERTIEVVRKDIADQNVSQGVGNRLIGELQQAAAACRAGRAREGEATLVRIQRTYNYR
jgi:hypothetical protein